MAHPGQHAVDRPDDVALIMATTGETITRAELHRRAVATANTLHRRGLRVGDSIAFCVENRFDDDLPRKPTGKLMKQQIRERYLDN